jgi:glycosyltransferase involved in cell wall biosynthesis
MKECTKAIVILTPAFPADEEDSVWVPAVQLFVKKLREIFPSGRITVLSFNYPHHTQTYVWQGVEVISFNGLHTKRLGRRMIWVKAWRKLTRIKKDQKIIGILSFWCGECALVGRYFARRHKLKHYCWISGMDAKKDNKLVKWIRPRAGELIAMSTFLRNEFFRNHGVLPQHQIPIGIDPTEYGVRPVRRDIDVLGVGSFNPFKQYDVFIRVVKQISSSLPTVKAVICGGGTDRNRLEKLISELGLENNIKLVGVRPHSEVLQWMQRSRIFLHPSSYEGFGLVYLEALYAGAQVIGFTYPLAKPAPHWHVVPSIEKMIEKALDILQDPHTDYTPVLVHSMVDSVKAVMNLFETRFP